MTGQKADIVAFVEDPGAANYVAGLPRLATEERWDLRLFVGGIAARYLADRGVAFEEVGPDWDAPAEIERLRPNLVLVGTSENPRTAAHALVDASRELGIPSVGVVDGFSNAAHRFRGVSDTPLRHAPDWMLVPDFWTRDAFTDLGADPGRVRVCGHPHYDRVRETGERLRERGRGRIRAELFPEVSAERPIVVFLAEVSAGLDPAQFRRSAEYTLTGRGDSDGRTQIVLEEILDAVAGLRPKPYFTLRLHPKNTGGEFAAYSAEIDRLSEGGSPLELVFAADLVVGMTSMLLVEAALLGVPTLGVVPRAREREWLPGLRSGAIPCAASRDELREGMARSLAFRGSPARDGLPELGSGSMERIRQILRHLLTNGRQP